MTDPNPQPSTEWARARVLLPALVEAPFDYLVPGDTKPGTLVEANLAGRTLVGVVWDDQKPEKWVPLEKLKPVTQIIESLPPLSASFRKWIDAVSNFTLAPKGVVLSLCGLSHALKHTRKAFVTQVFDFKLPSLTAEQQHALNQLLKWTSSDHKMHETGPMAKTKPILLDGVTGSGKTEVYFHAIARVLSENTKCGLKSQVLVLLPEISLTQQWLTRFEKAFGVTPVLWHSRLSPSAKARAWQAIATGEAQVVVGARSALFHLFRNLKLIIVDEEHDLSYKQEDGVLYHARDMAVLRAHYESIPVLLVSATPSLETLENLREGKYQALHLSSRYGSAGLPEVRLVDLRIDTPERGDFLSPTVKQAALETLARGEQVLFFLNRRGYAPLLLCRACGHRFQCADCSAWLVVHGKKVIRVESRESSKVGRGTYLSCHHCGHKEKFPNHCPACNAESEKLAPCGPGVERIAEEVGAFVATIDRREMSALPVSLDSRLSTLVTFSIATLSSDESVSPQTWAAIEAGEIDILVGTQMVAKGHHFPRLTLVVVVDADAGLDGADLRAGERTYQLLHQLGGRAGRGELMGQVLVQTYNPDHPVMKAIKAQDRDRLMALEAKERKAGSWPPFGQLAAILLDGKEEAAVRAAGLALARTAPEDARIRVLGPAPAPLSKLRGQYRYRLLVKADHGIHLQRSLRAWLTGQKFKGVRVKVDVNPYYFL